MYLTKSDYLRYKQCLKALWLAKNHDGDEEEPANNSLLEKGLQVTELARDLFPGGELVPLQSNDQMVQATSKLIRQGVSIIYEATFEYDGMIVRCDLLIRGNDGWNIYEVKSSTSMKERYKDDIALQTYVLKQNKLPINSSNLVVINNKYTRDGDLDVNNLFNIVNVTEEIQVLVQDIKNSLQTMKKVIGLSSCKQNIGLHCEKYGKESFDCEFKALCWEHIPEYSVFDITRIGKKKFELYQKGIVEIDDVPDDYPLSEAQQFQVNAYKKKENIFKKEEIQEFLSDFQLPLYFIDFETYQQTIPLYDGISPYQQIPFQYSLHIVNEDLSIEHKEFLAEAAKDPRRALAEKLVQDIPKDACSVAYNMGFEKMVLKNLAATFSELEDHLMKIHDNMLDLMVPFQKKWFYLNEMRGSYSIKYVLPALFPGDPELDYKNLEVQNGSKAMELYESLHLRPQEEVEKIRKDLLDYCRLDTYAMVRVWEKLCDL